jgi:bifunctional DNA-binding transcriptional regulator/antitoxin component of YhaV-PrlF toxin-antitoxin module
MLKSTMSGTVGKRGAIVLPAATRRRYGLEDGTLFISEECVNGILIRPAKAVPTDLAELRNSIQQGIDELDRGDGIEGEEAIRRFKKKTAALRSQKK